MGNIKGAIADLDEAIYLQPDYAEAYHERGCIRWGLALPWGLGGETKLGVLTDLNEAIRLQPDYAEVYFDRGWIRFDFGDKSGAIADLDEAIRLQPDYAKAYYERGGIKSKLGDKQSAIADYQEAVRLCQQQGNRKGYDNALKQIETLEKKSKGFWERLFS